ncbi:MAG: hypothetical protein HOP11_10645, partial [Saprospiraceae bacterium]|nr:hypothetical protein [Saprospiraceae bacterium]
NNVPVLIDIKNSIIASLRVYDLRPNKATALWPAQNIIEQYLDFNLRRLNVQLTYTDIKSGRIFLRLKSTIDDTLHFYYDLPGAKKNGVPFRIIKDLPPGTPSSPSEIREVYDFKGYSLDLSGTSKDTFNATPNSIIVRIDSTGVQKTFSKEDNIIVELGFEELKPTYATGYMGQDTFNFGPSEVSLDYFKNITGNVNFDQAALKLVIENNIGTDAVGEIKNLKAINSINNKEVELTSNILNQTIKIDRATDNNGTLPVKPTFTTINLDKDNSNVNSLINTLPDKIQYGIQMRSNPQGDLYRRKDFIYDGKLLDINLQLDVPLSLSAQGIKLQHVEDFVAGNVDLQEVIDGTLHILSENKYPLDVNLLIEFISDINNNTTVNFTMPVKIQGADLNSTGQVDLAKSSKSDIPISFNDIEKLKQSNKVRISATLDTRNQPNIIRIYDSYDMDIAITASFNYKID